MGETSKRQNVISAIVGSWILPVALHRMTGISQPQNWSPMVKQELAEICTLTLN